MAVGPLIQSIVTGDPVAADTVYGNDVAIRDFVSSLPNENLAKPMATASISGYLGRAVSVGVSPATETHYFGYSTMPTLAEALGVLEFSVYVVVDLAPGVFQGATIQFDVQFYDVGSSAWVTAKSQTLDGTASSGTGINVSISDALATPYGYMIAQSSGTPIPPGSKVRFMVVCASGVTATNITELEAQVFLKVRHQES